MIGVGLVGMVIAVLLRQYKPEYAVFVSLAVGILIIGMLCSQLLPIFDELKEMLSKASLSLEYIGILIKSLGVCYLTQLASDACRDAGETAISSKLELAGKIAATFFRAAVPRKIAGNRKKINCIIKRDKK